MVDAQELRCHRTGEDIAQLSLDLRAHSRDVAVIGMSTLCTAQTQHPLEELGIALDDTHASSLGDVSHKTARTCELLRFYLADKTARFGEGSRF